MKLFIDSAKIDEIEYGLDVLDIDGITTNPRHVMDSGKPFTKVIREIAKLVEGTEKTVSVEVNPHYTRCEEMVAEAEQLAGISPNFVIKLQCIEPSFKAARYLSGKGIRVNLTLIFSAVQALQAMRCGAYFISPFIGWKETNGEEIVSYLQEVVTIRDNYGFDSEIIFAAVRNGRQITQAAVAGADIVTAGLTVYREAFDHPYTRDGINRFQGFWDRTPYE